MTIRIDNITPPLPTHRFVVLYPDGTSRLKELPDDPALYASDLGELLGVPDGGSIRYLRPGESP